MIEKMKNIVVFVRDFEAAKNFYKNLLQLPVVNESVAIIEFFPGPTTLARLWPCMTLPAAGGRHTDTLH